MDIYDKIIVGAGVAGLASAYEILSLARSSGRSIKLAVLTDKISAPSHAGTNIVLGFDGFEEGELPPNAAELNDMVRGGLERIGQIVQDEKISCRHDLYFQLVAPTNAENIETIDFLLDRFRYRADEFRHVKNPADRLHFTGLGEAIESDVIGQLNGPEFLEGIARAIRRMGGLIIEGTLYTGHARNAATFEIQTTNGMYTTLTPPLLAGGPHLMSEVANMPVQVTPRYTMAMHVELTAEDAKKVCKRPVAFFNPNFDFLWGSLDGKNVLTIGQVSIEEPVDRHKFEAQLRRTFDALLPELKGKYDHQISFSFNAMAFTENGLPIVGRLADFDVITGNGGRGFAQSFAEAHAYAQYFINGNDQKLKLFESLNSGQQDAKREHAI